MDAPDLYAFWKCTILSAYPNIDNSISITTSRPHFSLLGNTHRTGRVAVA